MQVRVLRRAFLNNRIVEPGDVIEYDGLHGDFLEPVKGRKKKAEDYESEAESWPPAEPTAV